MNERDWVFGAFEFRGDVHPATEAASLAPSGGVFLKYFRIEALGDRLMYSIVVS